MKTTSEKITADLTTNLNALIAEGRSAKEASAEVAILLAVASGNVKDAPPPAARAHTLSDRTKQIMTEKKLPFARAQSEASKEFRRMIVGR